MTECVLKLTPNLSHSLCVTGFINGTDNKFYKF